MLKMTQKYPHLCEPITIGRVNFRNRMFSAPILRQTAVWGLAHRVSMSCVQKAEQQRLRRVSWSFIPQRMPAICSTLT